MYVCMLSIMCYYAITVDTPETERRGCALYNVSVASEHENVTKASSVYRLACMTSFIVE